MYRPETREYSICTTVPAAASTTVDITNIPRGFYNAVVTVNGAVTGTTTALASVIPIVSAKGSTAAVIADKLVLWEIEGTTDAQSLTFGSAAETIRYATILANKPVASGTAGAGAFYVTNIFIRSGLRFTITKGGATTGEPLEIVLHLREAS